MFSLDAPSLEFFLSIQASRYGKVAYFASEEYDLKVVKKNLLKINPELNIIKFPSFDCFFFSNVSPTLDNKSQRISALYELVFPKSKNIIFLSTLNALTTNTLKYEFVESFNLVLKTKSILKYQEISNFLFNAGYERVDFVHNKGEYSIRGEIMDIFSPIHQYPLRILFDFDKVESLNLFSIDDQLSNNIIDNYTLSLSSEFQFNSNNIECFRKLFRKIKIKNKDDYYKSISERIILPGSEQFFPILNESFDSLTRYLSGFKFILESNYREDFIEISNQPKVSIDEYKKLEHIGSNFFSNIRELNKSIKNNAIFMSFDFLSIEKNMTSVFSSNLNLKKNKILNQKEVLNLISTNKKIIFCYSSKISKTKIINFLKFKNVIFREISKFNFLSLQKNMCNFFVYEYQIKNSFVSKSNESSLYFISDQDIYGKTFKKTISKSIKEENLIDDYSNLKIGDYIVHNDHGVGKYNGLISRKFNNNLHEFIELIYHGNDKLLIPVENLDLISKYGQSDLSVNLDKLGLQSWQQRKALVKKRIKDIANNLIRTAAERKLQKGEIIIPKRFEYEKFSSEFEFTETSDQLKSIYQIENDLSSGQPMDRLICGDVGLAKQKLQ